MRPILLLVLVVFLPLSASAISKASAGKEAFFEVKHCVMENDAALCHAAITPSSYSLFDRFASYHLMPCLPTDFTYQRSEPMPDGHVSVVASMPAGGGQYYILRMLFMPDASSWKLDIPASLRRGLGENWENKIQLSEQLYLLMRQNLGDKLTCDQLAGLVK